MKFYKQNLMNFFQVLGASKNDLIYISELQPDNNFITSNFVNLAVWNTFKGFGSPQFFRDLQSILSSHDIVCLQEALLCEQGNWHSQHELRNYVFSASYKRKDGLLDGLLTTNSLVRPSQTPIKIISPNIEPITGTNKISMLTNYKIGRNVDGNELAIVNVHATLFRRVSMFIIEIEKIFEALKIHKGPAIICGDFNTFSWAYMEALSQISQKYGFSWVVFDSDPRPNYKKLDHIFIRDLVVHSAKIDISIKSSDHFLLSIKASI